MTGLHIFILNSFDSLLLCVCVVVAGYGWPAYKGGPLFYADQIVTLPLLLTRLERLSKLFPDSDYYSPSALLRAMVAEDVSILDLQKDSSQEVITRLRAVMASDEKNEKESSPLSVKKIKSRL